MYKRLFVCINSLSYQWTPTGNVNASVSGSHMLNRYRTIIISPHKSHMKLVCHHQDVYTISIHHFHYCVSPFTTLIRCCAVALRNLRKLCPNDVTKFGQLMQNCKLVIIHTNTTTGNDITGVRHCFSLQLLQPSTGRAPEPC